MSVDLGWVCGALVPFDEDEMPINQGRVADSRQWAANTAFDVGKDYTYTYIYI